MLAQSARCFLIVGFLTAGLFVVGCNDDEPDPAPIPDEDVSVLPDAGDTGTDTGTHPDTAEDPDAGTPVEPPDLVQVVPAGEVRAGIIQDSAALLPGAKSDGRVGDIKMFNANAAWIIEAPGRARGGYRFHGGNVVDALPVGALDGDSFGETWNTWNLHAFEPETVEIVSDGSDGLAHVRFEGSLQSFTWAQSFLGGFAGDPPVGVHVTVEYRLKADENRLQRHVTLANPTSQAVFLPLPLMFSNQGDGIETWNRGDGFNFDAGKIAALILTGRDVAHAIVPISGELEVVFDYSNVAVSSELPVELLAGSSVSIEYAHVVVRGGASAAYTAAAELLGLDDAIAATISGTVELPASAKREDAWVAIRGGGQSMGIASLDDDNKFEIRIPAGVYDVTPFAIHHAAGQTTSVTVASGDAEDQALSIPEAGRIAITVVDQDGAPVDARATVLATGDTPSPTAPSDVRVPSEFAWGWSSGYGKASAVGYAVGGEVEVTVPVGTYKVVASRGFSYEIDEAEVTVVAGEAASVALTVVRVVDTSGWTSGDFHIHALRSPDSNTPYHVRARQAATDDLDMPLLTEHVQIGGLEQVAKELGLDSVIGTHAQEVTTFEFGHFNAFPMVEDDQANNYGAVYPYDKRPAELFQAIRDQGPGDEVIQVNHPRGGGFGSYFSWAGFDPEDMSTKKPEEWSDDFDAIEVFNGNCGGGDVLNDWIGMANAGWGKTLGSGSDSHREDDPIGMPRNWIQVPAASARADVQSVVSAVREGRMFVSCGPFVRFETADSGATLGDTVTVDDSGEIAFRVVVEAPSWMALTEAHLIRNGETVDIVSIDEAAGGVRLDVGFSDQPAADAWYAIDVRGTGNLMPVHKSGPPRAYTNPIRVDVDGDGWTPPGG